MIQGERRFRGTKRLLNEWAQGYARRLRPKTLHATYLTERIDTWRDWPLDPKEARWGGEPAAALLTDYLRAGVLTLYAERSSQLPALTRRLSNWRRSAAYTRAWRVRPRRSTSGAHMKDRACHVLRDARHYVYDNAIAPALEIASGDTVRFECPEAADGQFTAASTTAVLDALDWSRIHAMTGPIAVTGAQPGDTLKVEILELAHHGWGWSSVIPGFGLLADEFGEARLVRIWQVDDAGFARFLPGFRVPIDPFMGEMGVAWAERGPHPTMPPTLHGGNMDSRHTGAGCTLYFPVMVPGALFSTGDGHLAQGDGEVCGVAIEAPLDVTMRFTLLAGQRSDAVRYETRRPTTAHVDGLGHHVTTGTGPDLQQSARDAVRRMLDLIEARYGLAREDAYILCSVAADLKIAVPVLGPGHASHVTYHLPKSIFT